MSFGLCIRPTTRPLRPPGVRIGTSPGPSRCFQQFNRLSRPVSLRWRPQAPYLASKPSVMSAMQGARLITTEQARLLRRTAWDLSMACVIVALVLPSSLAIAWWISHEMMERDYPTPSVWSFRSRCYWHTVKGLADRSVTRGRIPDWYAIAHALEALLGRLEDTEFDGSGLVLLHYIVPSNEDRVHLTLNVSSVYDISSMPEPWRRGYFQALQESAKAAEAADEMVFDTTTQRLYMKEFMLGPSNADPVPLPPSSRTTAPLEENCVRYYPSADACYAKILATKGFTDRQYIEARISYGEWLHNQGRLELAETQFRDAVDIATGKLKMSSAIVDRNTAVIKHDAPYVTANLMDATNALAIHLARSQRLGDALPIFLSSMQAYKACTANIATSDANATRYTGVIPHDVLLAGLRSRLTGLFTAVEYPAAPPSGNEPLQRLGDENCKAGAVALYAAEILFATSASQRETALGWIKEVLDEARLRACDTAVPADDRQRCDNCMHVALTTWWSMAQRLKQEASSANTGRLQDALLATADKLPRWRSEELEHWEWAKRIDRDQWDEKLTLEQWKMWSWFPDLILRTVL